MIIRIESGAIPQVFGMLLAFGFLYNLFVGWLNRKGYDEGYTALLVVGGVGATLLIMSLLSSELVWLMFGAFAMSGFWMVIGSIWRHVRTRERSQKAIIDEAARLAE